jgi:hypothetical protein
MPSAGDAGQARGLQPLPTPCWRCPCPCPALPAHPPPHPPADYFHDTVNARPENGGQRLITVLMCAPAAPRRLRPLLPLPPARPPGSTAAQRRAPRLARCQHPPATSPATSPPARLHPPARRYLTTPDEGGETVFPMAALKNTDGPEWSECAKKGLAVKAIKGGQAGRGGGLCWDAAGRGPAVWAAAYCQMRRPLVRPGALP